MSTIRSQPVEHEDTATRELADVSTPSTAVVEAVAAASGRAAVPSPDSTDPLPPLFDAIDPDALDTLVASAGTDVTVSFQYAGYAVVIENGTISVSPA